MKKMIFFFALLVSFNAFSKVYETDGQKFVVEKVFEGSDVIWGFDFISTTEMIFSEREGKLKYLDLKTMKAHDISGAPKVFANSQGGLLDVYYDSKNTDLYLTYSDPDPLGATTGLFRGKISNDKKTLVGKRLFQAKAFSKTGLHFGSRVLIDKDGFIFLSVGERNDRDRAQELSNHQGKILRLTREGVAPADNPFVNTKGALPEIWSYGHRNPQGMAFDESGALFNAEFGPRGGDEVNLVEKGKNYGWPVVTYGKEYWGPSIGVKSKAGMMQPLYYWVPSISPSGIAVYNGTSFLKFKGNLFLATLSGAHLHRIVIDKDKKMLKEENLLSDLEERFRQVKNGPEGFIYLSTDSGKILRLKPAP